MITQNLGNGWRMHITTLAIDSRPIFLACLSFRPFLLLSLSEKNKPGDKAWVAPVVLPVSSSFIPRPHPLLCRLATTKWFLGPRGGGFPKSGNDQSDCSIPWVHVICHMTVTIKMAYTDVEIQLVIDNAASRARVVSLSPEQRDSITRIVS